jgi:tRNA(Ile)-lysidine synthase
LLHRSAPRNDGSLVSATPLTADEFAAALDAIGGFEAQPCIAIAVSGGPDSLALALLADDWARRRGGQATALTVDHGLRPESEAEAQTVAGWLAVRGIPHDTLAWTGSKPKTGIQEAAREARYGLLAGWCREHGCLHLLTAHQREDQAETYLIRDRAKSGTDGLAGMTAVRELDGCRLVRPLLAVPRARLLAFLAAERQPFLSDPSNENPNYERSRLRLDADPDRIDVAFGASRDFGRLRIEREHHLAHLLAQYVSLHPAGFACVDRAILDADDPEPVERALAGIAATIGGARYPLRRERVARLRGGLRAAPARARTLGRCRFVPWRGRLLVLRELAAAEPPITLRPGECCIWDRRFRVCLPSTAKHPSSVGYLGQSGLAAPEPLDTFDLPRLVFAILPAFWDDNGLAAVPALSYRRVPDTMLPSLGFQPAHPLTTAGFTVV